MSQQPTLLTRAHQQPVDRNPLQNAFDDYQRMEAELRAIHEKNNQLLVQNMSLVAEVNMMREAYERADTDRIRLQAISSTLLGRLLAINDAIGGAVRASIKDGVEAVEAKVISEEDREAEERDAQDVQEVLQRVQPIRAPEPPAEPKAAPEPSLSRVRAIGAPTPVPEIGPYPNGQSHRR